MDSIRKHSVPEWYHAAKFGIFIHWGLYSVPAYAPPVRELGEITPDINWYGNNPYSEWYMNSVRVGSGPSYEHHMKTYGPDFSYNKFVDGFDAEKFDAEAWASLFEEAGARYVVPVTKHHDGFCLWDSKYSDFSSVKQGPKRDFIDELSEAVREKGMKLGLYYSGILDWQFASTPIIDNDDLFNPPNVTAAYADYAFNQTIELIDKYKPSVLWNDIAWPHKGLSDLPMLFSYYYNHVPEGVVNDRWSGVWHDFTTVEYKQGNMDLSNKWEMCRGLGLSFAYNAEENDKHILARADLISLLVKTVSHNGNLLINVGPRADGSIPEIQAQRLKEIGAWLKQNGRAIYDTNIWDRPLDLLPNDTTAYYTQNEKSVFALIEGVSEPNSEVVLPHHSMKYQALQSVSLNDSQVSIVQKGDDIHIKIHEVPAEADILVFEFVKQ